MITSRPLTHDDWTAASAWWAGPYAVPRATTARYKQREYTHAFEDEDGVLVAIGGLVGTDDMAPGTGRLSLAVSPDVTVTDWWLFGRLQTLLIYAFSDGGLTKVFGTVEREPSVPTLFETWRWLTDRLTRDTATHVAAGGWHHVKEGDTLDADTAQFLYLDWQKAQ